PHRCRQLRYAQGIERGQRASRRIEAKRLDSDPLHQHRFQVDVQCALAPAPAPAYWNSGWHDRNRSQRWRSVPLDVRVAQIQFIRWAGVQAEQVMGQGAPLKLAARHVRKPGRLKPGPPEQMTRDGRCDERVTLEGSE